MHTAPTITLKNTLFIAATLLMVGLAYSVGSRVSKAVDGNAQTRLGVAQKALADGHGKLALTLFKPLAKKGNAQADYWLADIYGHGVGTAQDESKAIVYLKKAAAKGYVPAEARLGRLYAIGDRTVQDFAKANTWLSKAAMKGNAAAERRLGKLYEQGLGVKRDPVAAYAWYENAVLRGDIPAERLRNHLVAQLPPAILAKAETRAKSLNHQIGQAA